MTRVSGLFTLDATVTASSTWPCDKTKPFSKIHGHVEHAVTVAHPSSNQ